MDSPTVEVRKFFFSSLFSFISIIFTIVISDENELRVADLLIKDSHKLPLAIAFIIAIPLSTIALPAFREAAKHYFGHFKWWGVPAAIYTSGSSADFLVDKLLKNKSNEDYFLEKDFDKMINWRTSLLMIYNAFNFNNYIKS